MWHPTPGRIEQWIASLLHIHDTPERTAFAFAMGVTIGFSPLVGLHTIIGLVLAFVFNLNRVAVLAGIFANLPWIFGPYYAAMTMGGAWVCGTSIPPQLLARIDEIRSSIRIGDWNTVLNPILALGELLRPLLLPFAVGSTVGCLILGMIAYRATLPFLMARKRHLEQTKQP